MQDHQWVVARCAVVVVVLVVAALVVGGPGCAVQISGPRVAPSVTACEKEQAQSQPLQAVDRRYGSDSAGWLCRGITR